MAVYHLILLISWNPKIVSLKIVCEKMSDEKSRNLHEQRYTIKFCVKLKKMVTEIKEILDAACDESAMS